MAISRRSAIKAPEPARTLTAEGQVRWDLIVAGVAVVVILIDQITKALVHAHFSGKHLFDMVPVIGNIISLEYDENRGAAFSSFTDSPLLLGFLITIAVAVIAYMYWTNRERDYPLLKVTFGMIAGGAVGNLIDRMRLGYVTDFIHFQLPAIHRDFFIFNIADSAISIGVVLLAFVFWTLPREEPQAPGADAKSAAVPLAQATTVPAAKAPVSTATRTPTNPVKPPLAGTMSGTKAAATSKTPTSPVTGAASTPRATTAGANGKVTVTAATKSPTRGAPVATATRSSSGSKSKGKRRS